MDYGAILPVGTPSRHPRRGRHHRGGRPGPARPARTPAARSPGRHRHLDEFVVEAGDELMFSMTWIPSYERTPPDAPTRPSTQTIADESDLGGALPRRRTARGRRTPLAAHPAADDPRADRRHRGRADHVAARGLRRRAQLGLPLLLAARRGADHRVADRRRATPTRPGSGGTGCCARSPATPTTCRSCTPSTARGTCPSTRSTTCPATQGSRPVRIGNGAVEQRQTDVLGEVMVALGRRARAGLDNDEDSWGLQRAWSNRLVDTWRSRTTASGRSAARSGGSRTRA